MIVKCKCGDLAKEDSVHGSWGEPKISHFKSFIFKYFSPAGSPRPKVGSNGMVVGPGAPTPPYSTVPGGRWADYGQLK